MSGASEPDRYQLWREQIDRIDGQMLALLNQRAAAALEIGRVKRSHNEPIYVPERERAVLERLAAANPGPLSAEAIRTIYQAIIGQIRTLEENHSAP